MLECCKVTLITPENLIAPTQGSEVLPEICPCVLPTSGRPLGLVHLVALNRGPSGPHVQLSVSDLMN